MTDFVERRKADRRLGPIRSGEERRHVVSPPPTGPTRSGQDRRQADRRKGIDRRITRPS